MDSSSLSHTRYKCQYHIVFIPKYRKRIMYGRLKADVREIIKRLCDYRNNRRSRMCRPCTSMFEYSTK